MSATTTPPAPRRIGGFALHLVFTGWILLVALVGIWRHRDVEELWRVAREGDPTDRMEALQALVPRADTEDLAAEFPAALLEAEDARLRELAFGNIFGQSKLTLTHEDLARITDPDERFRAALWLHCQTRTPRRVTRADLDTWFANPPSPGP